MADGIIIDFGEMNELVNRLSSASKDFKGALLEFVEALGMELLKYVQDEIVSREVVNTRLLLNSFTKGSSDGIWELNEGGFTLEVGTNVEYAKYVNDGHWKNPKGVQQRWVPGVWDGDKFTYDPNAKTGMLLKQGWVPGKHYWDVAIEAMSRVAPKFVEKKLDEWMVNYFKDFI